MDGLTWCLCLLTVAPALSVMGTDSCQRPPWRETECCSEGRVHPGAEEGLSVNCDSENFAHVQWSHTSLSILPPELIQLYSHCVNPTNTTQWSISTLLYNAHGIYLETSTTIPQLPSSPCTYFGCYVSNYAEDYYTFSEGSCTSSVAVTLQMELQSTNKQQQTSIGPSISPWTIPGTTPEQTLSQSSIVTLSTLPHQPPTSSLHGAPTSVLLWLIPLLLVIPLCAIVTSVLMLIRRSCTERERWKKKIPWHTQLPLDSKFEEFDHRSIHSEHTLYEDIACLESKNTESVSDEPILLHHWCTENGPGSSNTSTTDSGNASYITDGSLNYLIPEQLKSQSNHSNGCGSLQAGGKTSSFEHLAQSNSDTAQ